VLRHWCRPIGVSPAFFDRSEGLEVIRTPDTEHPPSGSASSITSSWQREPMIPAMRAALVLDVRATEDVRRIDIHVGGAEPVIRKAQRSPQ
jgi:hypothetical protein